MKLNSKILKVTALFGLTAIIGVGCYNSLVINSHSSLDAFLTNKRIDEMYGDIKVGRVIAVEKKWQKIAIARPSETPISTGAITSHSTQKSSNEATPSVVEAFIQEDLELQLSEVVNPKRWKQPLTANDYSGKITANNGIIESLNVSLPGNASISVAFGELTGNVFEYEHDGGVYTGLMYQVDANSYMVTLTNGPLEGTRMRFNGPSMDAEATQLQNQQYLAENHNIEPGTFGSDEEPVQEQVSEMNIPASTYDFNQPQAI